MDKTLFSVYASLPSHPCVISRSDEGCNTLSPLGMAFIYGKECYIQAMETVHIKTRVSTAPRGFGDLERMAIYFQGAWEHW